MGHEHDTIVDYVSTVMEETRHWDTVDTEVDYLENGYSIQGDVDVLAVKREEERIHLYCLEVKTNWASYGTGEKHPLNKNTGFAEYWIHNIEEENYTAYEVTSVMLHDINNTLIKDEEPDLMVQTQEVQELLEPPQASD